MTTYILEITNKGLEPIYTTSTKSLTECRKYVIGKMTNHPDSRGIISKISAERLKACLESRQKSNLKQTASWWRGIVIHNASHVDTILWDKTYRSWRLWKPGDNEAITLINADGSTKKVSAPMKYLSIPSLDAKVEIATDTKNPKKEYLAVVLSSSIQFLFTRDGKKCIEIWDVHTGEDVVFNEKEVKAAISRWYPDMYSKRVLPALKKFLNKEKK